MNDFNLEADYVGQSDPRYEEAKIVNYCECCGNPIYEGDTIYKIPYADDKASMCFCKYCIESFEEKAE